MQKKFTFSAWQHVEDLVGRVSSLQVHWIPSHGKHQNWRPPDGMNVEWCRELNKHADLSASSALESVWLIQKPERDQWTKAMDWSKQAIELQAFAGTRLRDSWEAQARAAKGAIEGRA